MKKSEIQWVENVHHHGFLLQKTETTQDDKLTIVYTCKTIEETDSLK